MLTFPGITPVDYLILGHITQDLTPAGRRIGGTAAFAGLTAQALGMRVGIVTAWAEEQKNERLGSLAIANQVCETSTTFENTYTSEGRVQTLHHLAPKLDFYHVPESWRNTQIVHLGPVAQEISANIIRSFTNSDVYLTLQGWLRSWDEDGHIHPEEWPEAAYILQQARAAVISEEDVLYDQEKIDSMASSVPVLAVTKGLAGADIYTQGRVHRIDAPQVKEVDPTGAGDIFAAVFFTQLTHFGDPLQAAQFAVQVASDSVTRIGLAGAPTEDTLYQISSEVQ